jgi:hypothetical protein
MSRAISAQRGRSARLWFLLGAALLVSSCASEPDDPTGGETHFLTRCDPNAQSCGDGLSCLCGVCTVPCSEHTTCQSFSVATCATADPASSCSGFQTQGHCEVSCAIDADCAALSPLHRCEQGACRAEAPRTCVSGQVSASEVLLLGDSFFALSHELGADLETIAQSAGTLAPGQHYRDNSNLTANALSLGGPGIATQFADGIASAPVKVVVMNGGGADISLGTCNTADATCPMIAAAASAAEDLLSTMANSGVEHVVYAFYPNPIDPGTQAKMDALRPLIQGACASSPVPCHWLDLRPTFAGHYNEYILPDGLNPTPAGSQAAAAAIWQTMQQSCVAQ